MITEDQAIDKMNEAAGLRGGLTDDCAHRGISLGYIGNVERGGRDDRSWGFFRPHHDNSKRMIGHYPGPVELLEAFARDEARFITWAEGART